MSACKVGVHIHTSHGVLTNTVMFSNVLCQVAVDAAVKHNVLLNVLTRAKS